jgi:hypothetical protein
MKWVWWVLKWVAYFLIAVSMTFLLLQWGLYFGGQ